MSRVDYSREYRLRNRDRILDQQSRYRQNLRDSNEYDSYKLKRNKAMKDLRLKKREIINRLKSKPCADCKIQYEPHVMQFDHLGEKSFELGVALMKPISQIYDEARKCEVVCANCHQKRTHDRKIENG